MNSEQIEELRRLLKEAEKAEPWETNKNWLILKAMRNALPELLGEIERLQLLADGYTTKQLKDMGYDADR